MALRLNLYSAVQIYAFVTLIDWEREIYISLLSFSLLYLKSNINSIFGGISKLLPSETNCASTFIAQY